MHNFDQRPTFCMLCCQCAHGHVTSQRCEVSKQNWNVTTQYWSGRPQHGLVRSPYCLAAQQMCSHNRIVFGANADLTLSSSRVISIVTEVPRILCVERTRHGRLRLKITDNEDDVQPGLAIHTLCTSTQRCNSNLCWCMNDQTIGWTDDETWRFP